MSEMSKQTSTVKVNGELAFEAFPGIFVYADGVITTQQALDKIIDSVAPSSEPMDIPVEALTIAEMTYNSMKKLQEEKNK